MWKKALLFSVLTATCFSTSFSSQGMRRISSTGSVSSVGDDNAPSFLGPPLNNQKYHRHEERLS